MLLHTFVAMPFGVKQGIDFNRVYADYICPGLESAGFEVFRADQEQRAGDIRTDMFQELLLADLVVVDLSIDNPNVWYELGVRHALRARGVLLVQSERDYQPFDIYTDRKLHYHLKDGVPDAALLEQDRAALAEMAKATVQSWQGRRISPVFSLLEGLQEPDWRDMLLGGHNEFRDTYETWRRRIEVARKGNRAGDVMVLAEETPTWALAPGSAAHDGQGAAQVAAISPGARTNSKRRWNWTQETSTAGSRKASCWDVLGAMTRHGSGRQRLLTDRAGDPECWCLLGRLEKEEWVSRWRLPTATPAAHARSGGARAAPPGWRRSSPT